MHWEVLFEAVEFEGVPQFVELWDAEEAQWLLIPWVDDTPEPEWPAE